MRRCGWLAGLALVACGAPEVPQHAAVPPIRRPPARATSLAVQLANAGSPDFPSVSPFRLPHTFEPTRYRAHLALEEHAFTGHVEIDGELSDQVALIWLHGVDLVVSHATASQGTHVVALEASAPRDDQLLGLFARPPLPPGKWTLTIDYTGSIQAQQPPHPGRYGMEDPPGTGVFRRVVGASAYVYTQSEAIYARRIFPCIDEPDRKVPWQLTLDVPKDLVAASNTPIVRETALAGDRRRVEFAETRPLPSYLIAFAVGPFDAVDLGKTKSGVPVRVLALRGGGARMAKAAADAPHLLDTLEAWTAIPYAYGKLDLVEVPHMGIGAMENPGLVTIDQEVLGKPYASGIIAHELSHQWFGDLVTPRWWDDVWLNESFANWMAGKLESPAGGGDRVDERIAALERLTGYGMVPVRPQITSNLQLELPEFPGQGPDWRGTFVLELLEAYLGEDRLRDAIRVYLVAHVDRSATTADLAAALDQTTGVPLDATLVELLADAPPVLEARESCDARPAAHFRLLGGTWPVCVAYDRDGKRAEACGTIDPTSRELALPAKKCPRWIYPEAGGVAPYRLLWDGPMVDDLLAHGWRFLTADERRSLFTEVSGEAVLPEEIEIFTRLVASHDVPPPRREAYFLENLAKYVPADLRARFDAWIEARHGAAARATHLQLDAATTDVEAKTTDVELAALAGDPELARDAAPLATDQWPTGPFASAILLAATDGSLEVATKLLAKAPRADGYVPLMILDALSQTHRLADLVKGHPDAILALGQRWMPRLFASTCDPAVRDALAALAKANPDVKGFDPSLAEIDHCRREQAIVAPHLRAWLAPAKGRP